MMCLGLEPGQQDRRHGRIQRAKAAKFFTSVIPGVVFRYFCLFNTVIKFGFEPQTYILDAIAQPTEPQPRQESKFLRLIILGTYYTSLLL